MLPGRRADNVRMNAPQHNPEPRRPASYPEPSPYPPPAQFHPPAPHAPIPLHAAVPKARPEFPIWGVLLVLLGALFLAAQNGQIQLLAFIQRWWPIVPIAIGGTMMVNERRVFSPGITPVLIGGFVLFFTLRVLRWEMFLKIWPIVLVAGGVSVLIGARRKPWL